MKIKRLVYITKKGVNPFGLTPLSSGFRLIGTGAIVDSLLKLVHQVIRLS